MVISTTSQWHRGCCYRQLLCRKAAEPVTQFVEEGWRKGAMRHVYLLVPCRLHLPVPHRLSALGRCIRASQQPFCFCGTKSLPSFDPSWISDSQGSSRQAPRHTELLWIHYHSLSIFIRFTTTNIINIVNAINTISIKNQPF